MNESDNPIYLAISSCYGKGFSEAIQNMKNRGISVFVVIPVHGGTGIGLAATVGINVWEAP